MNPTPDRSAEEAEDPLRGALIALAAQLEDRISAWELASGGDRYIAEARVLDRITSDFVDALRITNVAFTRYPDSANWLVQTFVDDFLESAISIRALATQGVFNVGRREMRYLVEAAVKHVFVDQQVSGAAKLSERLTLLNDTTRVPRSSVAPVDELIVRMVEDPGTLRGAVHSAFGALSGYTHLSKRQLDERLARAARGEFAGFESAATLEAFNKLLFQVYDIVLAIFFEGVGPAFTGELFIHVFDEEPRWRFHKGRLVGEISRHFDYKHERRFRS